MAIICNLKDYTVRTYSGKKPVTKTTYSTVVAIVILMIVFVGFSTGLLLAAGSRGAPARMQAAPNHHP